ncbi:hypothetical protein [Legionella impletisoli]|uniref:Uncharacterized protein n=1 Tax=Legionella impletisoli TaxID=343510 RepID=A0A917JU38_9GAMM|nr:hypothetical protein [Legionella impletisoli]GGI86581.1 hypothetical protein GCM10007966_14030 [Legionella impletisoli]
MCDNSAKKLTIITELFSSIIGALEAINLTNPATFNEFNLSSALGKNCLNGCSKKLYELEKLIFEGE